MPRVFGALPGPRNVPKEKQHLPNNQSNLTLSMTSFADAGRLAELLPPIVCWTVNRWNPIKAGRQVVEVILQLADEGDISMRTG